MRQFIETIKIYNGIFCLLDEHQKRIANTQQFFFNTINTNFLHHIVIPHHYQKGLVKCRIIYRTGLCDISFEHYEIKPLHCLKLVNTPQEINYNYKFYDRQHLNHLFQQKTNAADDIIITYNNFLTDSYYANIVLEYADGNLYTPTHSLLKGIKQTHYLNKKIIQMKPLTIKDIGACTKIHCINAMLDLNERVCNNVI